MKKRITDYASSILVLLAIAGCDNLENFFPKNVFPDKNKKSTKLEEVLSERMSTISPKALEILEDYVGTERKNIEKNDTYLEYAKDLQKKFNKLKTIRADEIYPYIQHRFNNGKELVAGKVVNLPIYEDR
jgi:hypothetical protein